MAALEPHNRPNVQAESRFHPAYAKGSQSAQHGDWDINLSFAIVATIAGVFFMLTVLLLAALLYLLRKQRRAVAGGDSRSSMPSRLGSSLRESFYYQGSDYAATPTPLAPSHANSQSILSQCSFCKRLGLSVPMKTNRLRASTGKIPATKATASIRPIGKSKTFNCLKGRSNSSSRLLASDSGGPSYTYLNNEENSETNL